MSHLVLTHTCIDPKITKVIPPSCKCSRMVRVRKARSAVRNGHAVWASDEIVLNGAWSEAFSSDRGPVRRVAHSISDKDIETAYAGDKAAAKYQRQRIEGHGEIQEETYIQLGALEPGHVIEMVSPHPGENETAYIKRVAEFIESRPLQARPFSAEDDARVRENIQRGDVSEREEWLKSERHSKTFNFSRT